MNVLISYYFVVIGIYQVLKRFYWIFMQWLMSFYIPFLTNCSGLVQERIVHHII